MFTLNSQSNNTNPGGSGAFGNTAGAPTATGSSVFGSQGSNPLGPKRSASVSGPSSGGTPGGLFGSSLRPKPAPLSGGLFGSSTANSTTNTASGGLFGSSGNPASSSSGLFGNSSSTNPASNANNASSLLGNQSTGLFGNSNTSASNLGLSSSLFAPKPATTAALGAPAGGTAGAGGLFGNSSSNTNPTGGLFGNNSTSSTATGGLFGNNSTTSSTTTGGLFGNSASNTNSGGLFGNKASNINSGGLFGNNTTNSIANNTTGGLFSNSNSNSSNLFGQSTNNVALGQNASQNPYNYDSNISRSVQLPALMPQSITESLYASLFPEQTDKKRSFSQANAHDKSHKPLAKSSLLSRLGDTISFLRPSNYWAKKEPSAIPQGDSSIRGLYSGTKFDLAVYQTHKKKRSLESTKISKGKFSVSDSFGHGDIKKLVIKSKPSKFHLIDTDKVFVNKRRRVLMDSKPYSTIDSSTPQNFSSDEDLDSSDTELNEPASVPIKQARFSYKARLERGQDGNVEESHPQRIFNQDTKMDSPDNNNGYWTSPSIGQLCKYSLDALREIDNFIIGRLGMGQISFNFPVDLSELQDNVNSNALRENLFGKVVEFSKRGIVEVYNKGTKPPVGFGMNIPATITLEGMFPKNGQSSSAFIRKLQGQKDMEFVTYDPITGNWTFKVQHFSIWGLVDDDDEAHPSSNPEEDAEKARYREQVLKESNDKNVEEFPGGWGNREDISSLDLKKNIIRSEIRNEIIKFNDFHAQNGVQRGGEITVDTESLRADSPMSFVLPEGEDTYEFKGKREAKFNYLKQLVSVLPKNISMDQLIDEKAYEPEISNEAMFDAVQVRPNLAVSDDWVIQLELANDMNSSLNPTRGEDHMILDIEKVDNVIFGANNFKFNGESHTKSHEITEAVDEPPIPSGTLKQIDSIKSKASITLRSNQFPIISTQSRVSFIDVINHELEADDASILKLCHAIFDEHDLETTSTDVNIGEHLKQLHLKEKVADWLREYNMIHYHEANLENSAIKSATSSDPLMEILQNVGIGDIKGSIEVALTSNNNHLSVLLSLLDANDPSVQRLAKAQLEYWDEFKSRKFIPRPIYCIYQILANEFDELVIEFPWFILFTLNYLYGNDNLSLMQLIKKFDEKYQPKSPVFSVLKLYQNLKTSPKTGLQVSELSELNLSTQWVIFHIIGQNSDYDSLTKRFGHQLVANGEWKDAIFVFSDISNDQDSKMAIKDVLDQSIDFIKGEGVDEEEYLKNNLAIPQSAIYESVAKKQKRLGNFWAQCDALVVAQLWEEVHECILQELGPTIIISNNSVLRRRLIDLVSKVPHRGLIVSQWKPNAGVLVTFIELVDIFEAAPQAKTLKEALFKESFETLLASLSNFKLPSDKLQNKVAFEIMTKRVGDWVLMMDDGFKDRINNLRLDENERQYFAARLSASTRSA